jgi:hypothetical protein
MYVKVRIHITTVSDPRAALMLSSDTRKNNVPSHNLILSNGFELRTRRRSGAGFWPVFELFLARL